MERHVLILSLWNPTPQSPGKGIFIHDQVDALVKTRSDIIFLEINILRSSKIFGKTISEQDFGQGHKIVITIHSVFWKAIYLSPWFIFYLTKKYLKKNHWDIKLIHSNVIFPCALVGKRLAKHFGAKHIISEHWSKFNELLKHPVYGRKAVTVYRESKAILCVSNFLANKIRLATHHSGIKIVPNIVNTELFYYHPKQPLENVIRFACCATWHPPKRLDLIFNSLLETASNHKTTNFILNVIGNGSQVDEFKQKVLPDNLIINWHGFVPKNEIVNTLHNTDYFLHASNVETFSIVTVEALSTGTPVLASNVGALPELINTNNGILVENTVEAWTNGLSEITKKKFNHQDIASGVSGKYSPTSVAERINKFYESVLKD